MRKSRIKKVRRKGKEIYYVAIILVIAFFVFYIQTFNSNNQTARTNNDLPSDVPILYHSHVDFKVFLEGQEINFNQQKFNEARRFVHLHLSNPNGDKIIHIEGIGNVSIGFFFETLGMSFNSTCFTLDTKESFCNNGNNRVKYFVNNNENFEFDLYQPNDLDRILITYGNETEEEVEGQLDSVSDEACIYSKKCPERIPSLPVQEDELKF